MLSLLIFSAVGFASTGPSPVLVDPSLFQPGRSWTWNYSQFNSVSRDWQPYYRETYTVSGRVGDEVTIEMSSHSLPHDDIHSPAHHKFIVDLRRCSGRTGEEWARGWTIQFYTRSPGQDWKLVSNAHPNLAFTEKFSCFQGRGVQRVESGYYDWEGRQYETFMLHLVPQTEPSWYFAESAGLTGVMAEKTFGNRGYRAVFTSMR